MAICCHLPAIGRLEFTVGAGYVHTKYDAYYNIPNGARYEKGIRTITGGLTKVGINLVCQIRKIRRRGDEKNDTIHRVPVRPDGNGLR